MSFAVVRVQKIKNLQQFGAMSAHGRRLDASSKTRVDPVRTSSNLVASRYTDDPFDLVVAFKAMKRETGAKEYKGAPIGLHILCAISPEVISEAGDVHDPANPLNQKIFVEAQKWVEAEFGDGSCIAARLDLDEAGGGVVDLFVCPVRESGRNKKPQISTNKALSEIREKRGQRFSYSALQDGWSQHVQSVISHEIKRGIKKDITKAENLTPEQYKSKIRLDERESFLLKASERGKIGFKKLRKIEAALKDWHSRLKAASEDIKSRRKKLEKEEKSFSQKLNRFSALEALVSSLKSDLATERASRIIAERNTEKFRNMWADADNKLTAASSDRLVLRRTR